VGHLVESRRTEIVCGNEWKDSRASVGSTVHVADMDFVERRLANAKNQRALLFEANVGGALDQVRRDAVGDTSQSSDAARQNDHGIGGIRAAGHVGSNIGIRLLVNFSRVAADELPNEVAAAAKAQFLRDDAESAVGSDEVYVLNTGIPIDGREQVASKESPAGSSRGHRQVLKGVRQLGPSSEIRWTPGMSQGQQ